MAVPLYGQKYPMSCWAASMRMILASKWIFVPDDDAIAAPTKDEPSLATGLNPNATLCLENWGFSMLAPASYTAAGFAHLVRSRGPLWVACDVRFPGASRASPHIRVVTGVQGEGSGMLLNVNDPGPVGRGSQYNESYATFIAKNELLGAGELKQPEPIYIAHM